MFSGGIEETNDLKWVNKTKTMTYIQIVYSRICLLYWLFYSWVPNKRGGSYKWGVEKQVKSNKRGVGVENFDKIKRKWLFVNKM